MTDPMYLSDENSEASEFERELLHAAQGVQLSAGEKQAIWASVALQTAPLIAVTPSAGPAAAATKSALALTPLVKGVLVVLGIGGLSVAGYVLDRSFAGSSANGRNAVSAVSASAASPVQDPPPSASQVSEAAVPAASAAMGSAPPNATARAPNPPATSRELGASAKKSALGDESAAVLEIRRALRAGDASHALRLLEQARQRFPKGALGQEREALTIEALAKSGARAAASRKAEAFLRAYPKSPYASDVQSFVAPQ